MKNEKAGQKLNDIMASIEGNGDEDSMRAAQESINTLGITAAFRKVDEFFFLP